MTALFKTTKTTHIRIIRTSSQHTQTNKLTNNQAIKKRKETKKTKHGYAQDQWPHELTSQKQTNKH